MNWYCQVIKLIITLDGVVDVVDVVCLLLSHRCRMIKNFLLWQKLNGGLYSAIRIKNPRHGFVN